MAKKRRAVPNFFTIGNLIGGMLAILFSLTDHLEWAPYCIFGAIIFDFLDGFMAGLLHAKSDKGKQMDSLADIVTFGVAPGFLVFVLLNMALANSHFDLIPFLADIDFPGFGTSYYISDVHIGGELIEQGVKRDINSMTGLDIGSNIAPLSFIAFLIPIFALFRLAKFNVDTGQSDSFLGVPTATMAIFFAAFPLLINDAILNSTNLKTWLMEVFLVNPLSLIILIIVFSILMVTRIPLIALKVKHFKWQDNEVRYIFLALCVLSLIFLKFWAIPVIVLLYILLSVINNILVKSVAKK